MREGPGRAAVVGTTSWGTTLAVLLARNGHEVTLLARGEAEAKALRSARQNERHRPGLVFPRSLRVEHDPVVLGEAELVVVAVPSQTLEENLGRSVASVAPEASILSAIKGIEPERGRRMSELIASHSIDPGRVLALSGPNFAAEIAAGLPAATVVAGRDAARTRRAQAMLNSASFRVYTSDDVAGVELGGALKNVVAIACGLSDGLGYGENAKAALITRGLAEIVRLGVACDARALTFLGLAGVGDLVLSCESDISRNRRLGLALAKGAGLEAAKASISGVVEGATTTLAVRNLARRLGIEMPICEGLYALLYEAKPPREAARELMARAARPEF